MEITAQNKQVAKTWLRLISDGDVEGICRITSATWKMHGGPATMPEGPEGVRYIFSTFDHIDQNWEVNLMIAEGDMVAVRATNTCVQASFLGIPAAGKRQVFTCTFIFHIVCGVIQQTWRNADDLGRLMQIGARLLPAEA